MDRNDQLDKKRAHKVRVAVLTNIVPGYRRKVLDAVRHDPWIHLGVFVSLPVDFSDKEASESLSLRYSSGINIRKQTRHRTVGTEQIEWLHIPVKLLFDLMFFRPDLIISGEFGLRSVIAYLIARLRRVPLVLWSEEIKEKEGSLTRFQMWFRGFLIPRADAFLAWGNPAVQYLRLWNVPDQKIHYCAQAVDNKFWQSQVQGWNKKELQVELGLRGKVFLAVGRLLALKGFDKLLTAWSSIPMPCQNENTLVLAGDGPEESALRQLAKRLAIPNMIFTGSVEPCQLAKWYASSDVLVFPSLVDVWGLVVNEAMACGVPVLASKYAGASQELVQGTGAGELFDPNNIAAFSALLKRWCEKDIFVDPDHIRAIVAQLNFDVSIASFKRVIAELTGGGRP